MELSFKNKTPDYGSIRGRETQVIISDNVWDSNLEDMIENMFRLLLAAGYQERGILETMVGFANDRLPEEEPGWPNEGYDPAFNVPIEEDLPH